MPRQRSGLFDGLSLPSWERGLKYLHGLVEILVQKVAPLVGAWIEISFAASMSFGRSASLPSWERGLKYRPLGPWPDGGESLPSWERGLKYRSQKSTDGALEVAPLVGAWIEIDPG